MNKPGLQNSLMLLPLIGATGSLMSAMGVSLMLLSVIALFGVAMAPLRSRLAPWACLPAAVLLAATLTSCAQIAGQAWSLQWQQHLGMYAGLIALQCVVLEYNGFFRSPRRDRMRLCGGFVVLMLVMGVLRELIGNGTLAAHLSWLTGAAHWPGLVLNADGGLRLATLAPGGFILLGLLIAGWQAWVRPTPSQSTAFEETHHP